MIIREPTFTQIFCVKVVTLLANIVVLIVEISKPFLVIAFITILLRCSFFKYVHNFSLEVLGYELFNCTQFK